MSKLHSASIDRQGNMFPVTNAPVFVPTSALTSTSVAQADPVDVRYLKLHPGSSPVQLSGQQRTPDFFPQYRGPGGFFRRLSNSLAPNSTGALHTQQDALIFNAQANRYNAQVGKPVMQPVNIPDNTNNTFWILGH